MLQSRANIAKGSAAVERISAPAQSINIVPVRAAGNIAVHAKWA
jgi:hypothetical protein